MVGREKIIHPIVYGASVNGQWLRISVHSASVAFLKYMDMFSKFKSMALPCYADNPDERIPLTRH